MGVDRYRVQQALLCAGKTTQPVRFAARELRGNGEIGTYRLRDSGLAVCLHHGTADLGIFDEVFRLGWYDWPAAVTAALDAADRPLRVADLGAHVGMFGVHVLQRFPSARIDAFEPDADNHAALVRCVAANRVQEQWQTTAGCAGAADGTTMFAGGESSGSKRVAAGEGSGTVVPVVDVLPRLADADLIKMDMEGGEWEIVDDPRFRDLRPAAMVLEYHAYLCPHPDPRAAIQGIVREMGYSTLPIWDDEAGGVGMLWALRES